MDIIDCLFLDNVKLFQTLKYLVPSIRHFSAWYTWTLRYYQKMWIRKQEQNGWIQCKIGCVYLIRESIQSPFDYASLFNLSKLFVRFAIP